METIKIKTNVYLIKLNLTNIIIKVKRKILNKLIFNIFRIFLLTLIIKCQMKKKFQELLYLN